MGVLDPGVSMKEQYQVECKEAISQLLTDLRKDLLKLGGILEVLR